MKLKNLTIFLLILSLVLPNTLSFAETKTNETEEIYYEITENDYINQNLTFSPMTIPPKSLNADSNNKLLKTVRKVVYVEKDLNGNERRLTRSKEDMKKIESMKYLEKNPLLAKITAESANNSEIKEYYKLTLYIHVFEGNFADDDFGYQVTGTAEWEAPSWLTSSMKEPATGDDCMAFSWGGNYHFESQKFTRIFDDESDLNPSDFPYRYECVVSNASCGWAFPERMQVDSYDIYVKNATASVDLKKPKNLLEGGDATLTLSYCHTYEKYTGSFSLGYNTGYITAGSVEDQWSDSVFLTIKK